LNGRAWRHARGVLPLGERTLVMGILNVTPDSFSDGGRYLDPAAAVDRAQAMVAEGADLIDVGAESTRPGGTPVPLEEERRRLEPVLERLVAAVSVPISIDTQKAAVAHWAVGLGVAIVNDVWGFQGDPAMVSVVAETGAGVVLMHNAHTAHYPHGVTAAVRAFLAESVARARAAGVAPEQIALDPGIGFGKEPAHSFAALRGLPLLAELGYPVLVGPSRKRFLGAVTGRPVAERLHATAGAVAAAVMLGADIVRVHDVAAMVDVVRVVDAIRRGEGT
jgi:dihydropteroate synthase